MLITAACGRYCAAPRTTTPVWQAAIGRIKSLAHSSTKQVCVGPADVAGPGGATDNVPMRILPLRLPGTWLEGDMSVEVRRDAEALFYLLESALADVAISLTMFETTRAGFRRDMESGPEHEERQRSAEQSVRARYDNVLRLE